MSFKTFLELVEIKAKTASIFPCLLGSLFAWYRYQRFRPVELLVFFVAMLLFNMAVDANDNYQDYRRAQRTQASDFRKHTNIIGREHLAPQSVLRLVLGLTLASAVLGLWLVSRTGWPLLVGGLFSFAVGFGYAGGPRPLSTTPVGEFFAGFTMGGVIWWLAVYVNVATVDAAQLWAVFWSSGLAQAAIAALLLANNIADEAEDIALNRRTIVYYLGRRRALWLFYALYAGGYLSLIAAVACGWLPPLSLLTLVTAWPVWRNTRAFARRPVKQETFILAVKNLLIITAAFSVFVALGVWWSAA